MLALYTGDTLAALTPVAANDDDTGKTTSAVRFVTQAGTIYQIAVAGKAGATGFTVLNLGIAPPNDAFASALALASSESARINGTTLRATVEAGEPTGFSAAAGATTTPGASAWYRWTAPRAGRFQLAAFSTAFDTRLAIFTGGSLASLALVTSNDNTGLVTSNSDSLCTIAATAGTTYYLRVDAANATVTGDFVLTVTDSLWQASGFGVLTGSPAVGADGTIYFGGGTPDRTFYAVAPDGTLKWAHPTTGYLDNASPAIGSDGTIYFGTTDGRVTALAPDRTVRWSRALTTTNTSVSPALGADDTIYLHAGDGFLYALAPADGATKWRTNVNARATFASASVAPDGTIYQISDDQNVYALRPDGTLKWQFATDGNTFSVPALDRAGNLYFTTYSSGKLWSLTPAGTLRWSFAVGAANSTLSSPTLSADGTVAYFGAANLAFYAINTTDGSVRWRLTLGSSVLGSSAAIDANGTIYVGCYDFKLYAINPTGTLKRTWDTGQFIRSSPAIFGTTLYVGSNDAKLYAFDLGAAPADGPWPQFRQNVRRLGRVADTPLAIAVAPQARSLTAGEAFTLSVTATGAGPLAYQWFKDGVAIPGATAATYTSATATAALAGSYTVRIAGPQGAVTSAPAAVTVLGTDTLGPARLVNLSILTALATPAETFTVGTVVGGAGTAGAKPLLVRAAGPSLLAFGVDSVLGDPKLELFTGTARAGENDNWGGAAATVAASARVGAFAFLSTATRDAALYEPAVPSGANSVRVSSAGAGTLGAVLAEIYDATPGPAFTPSTPRLVNLSVLKSIGGGLTAGFVLGGAGVKTVLLRAVGPALAGFGVGGPLPDPRLELFDGAGKSIGANDNWAGTTALAAAFAQTGAFALEPASRDAALVITLSPGSYTVQVRPAAGAAPVAPGTGQVLVEIYEVP